jgi:endonuclease G, mitochondrial
VAAAVYFYTAPVGSNAKTDVATRPHVTPPAYTHYIVINHTHYTSWFSEDEHIPLVVSFVLTADMINCSAEEHSHRGKFTEDPDQPDLTNLNNDYRKSGYDRGHNMSAADNECNADAMRECFYFSNITPQPHTFNAGKWEDLEKQERSEAITYGKIIVTVGSIGIQQQIGADSVAVPRYMWKVIYIPAAKNYECYLFPDNAGVTNPLPQYQVPLDSIETLAPVDFNDGVVKVL